MFCHGAIATSQQDTHHLAVEAKHKQLQEVQANPECVHVACQSEINKAQAQLSRIQTGQAEQIHSAQANLNCRLEVHLVDAQAATAQIKAKQAALLHALADLKQSLIQAPQEGAMLKALQRPGEVVAGAGVVWSAQTQQMLATTEVHESDVHKIQPRQAITITSALLPSKL